MKDDRGDLDLTKQIDDLKKEIEYLKKEITIAREDGNINLIAADTQIKNLIDEIRDKDRRIIDLMNINDSHKTTNGDLRVLNNQLLRENDKMKEVLDKSVTKLRENGEI